MFSVMTMISAACTIPVWNKDRGTSGTGYYGQIAVKPSKHMHDKYYKNYKPKPKTR